MDGHKTANILVIEDDEAFRRLVAQILERGGFNVFPVRDFTAAIQIIESNQPIELLLTDVGLPAGTPHGISIAQMAKTRRPLLKIVYMSGSYDPAMLRTMIDGASFLMKPFRAEKLIEAVETALA